MKKIIICSERIHMWQ